MKSVDSIDLLQQVTSSQSQSLMGTIVRARFASFLRNRADLSRRAGGPAQIRSRNCMRSLSISKLSWTCASESSSFDPRVNLNVNGGLRGTSRHQFLRPRTELSARLEMDCRKGQNGYGRLLRHQTRCGPSGSNLYRRSYRLGSVKPQRGSRLPILAHLYGPAVRCKSDMTV